MDIAVIMGYSSQRNIAVFVSQVFIWPILRSHHDLSLAVQASWITYGQSFILCATTTTESCEAQYRKTRFEYVCTLSANDREFDSKKA